MILLKKIVLILIFSFLILEPMMSQDTLLNQKTRLGRKDIKYPNIIKINTLALAFSNVSLVYETGIMPRLSVGVGIGYKHSGAEPQIFSISTSRVSVDINQIQGYSITPDIRYYLRTCNPELFEGFYGGIYFRYNHFFSTADFTYISKSKVVEHNHADIALDEYGIGIQLGYQLLLWERLSIDFLFFGPRISNYNFEYDFAKQPAQELLDDLSEYTNEVINRFGVNYNVEIKREGDLKANTSFSFTNTRFGLSIGFAF